MEILLAVPAVLLLLLVGVSIAYLQKKEQHNQESCRVRQQYQYQRLTVINQLTDLVCEVTSLKQSVIAERKLKAALKTENEAMQNLISSLRSEINELKAANRCNRAQPAQNWPGPGMFWEFNPVTSHTPKPRSVVSKIRLATNKPGQGSKTSEHPTSDHQDIDVELLILNHFFEAFVDVSLDKLEVAKHIVQPIVNAIFGHMQTTLKPSEPRVVGEGPLKSGSVEEQLKVLHPDEFDYMFPIEMPHGVSLDFSFCHQISDFPKESYGFGMIAIQTVLGASQDRFLKSFVEGKFLQADQMKNWFKGKTQKGIDHFNANKHTILRSTATSCVNPVHCDITAIKLSEIGAGVCLTIKYKDASFSVDLIPSVKVEARGDMYLIPKSCKKEIWAGDKQVKKNSLWRLSFSMYEMKLMNILTKSLPSSCHTDSLKIVKALRDLDVDNNPSSQLSSVLTSYHLKSMLLQILLSDLRRAPPCLKDKWSRACLADRIKELLEVAQSSARSKELHHVFLCNDLKTLSLNGSDLHSLLGVPDWAVPRNDSGHVNLFSENFIDPNSLDQISARIKDIQEQWLNVIYRHVSPLSMKIMS